MAAIPLVFTAVMHGGRAGTDVQSLVKTRWSDLGSQVQGRAGIALGDNFREGLSEWRGRASSKPAWSFDNAGFVHPGPLALFRPTVDLTDYRIEFRAQIDRQGLGFVFRARDFNNYYAVKLVIAEPGPLPGVKIVRYAVIQGREGPHAIRPLPLTVRSDTWYSVRLDIRGSDFTLNIQGQVVDCWSDARLRQGGMGFFCGKGEQARLRSVEVSHQNDALGKFCAYLKPSGGANK